MFTHKTWIEEQLAAGTHFCKLSARGETPRGCHETQNEVLNLCKNIDPPLRSAVKCKTDDSFSKLRLIDDCWCSFASSPLVSVVVISRQIKKKVTFIYFLTAERLCMSSTLRPTQHCWPGHLLKQHKLIPPAKPLILKPKYYFTTFQRLQLFWVRLRGEKVI